MLWIVQPWVVRRITIDRDSKGDDGWRQRRYTSHHPRCILTAGVLSGVLLNRSSDYHLYAIINTLGETGICSISFGNYVAMCWGFIDVLLLQ